VTRPLLDESRVHPSIRARIDGQGREVIAEVEAAVAAHRVVVVGMALNPFPRKARRMLDAAGVPYRYLEYGSYFSQWRKRLPLKLWTGWTTFPMIFVDGVFIGGAEDLARLGPETLKKGAA
jgi:glutaredoxin-related protein